MSRLKTKRKRGCFLAKFKFIITSKDGDFSLSSTELADSDFVFHDNNTKSLAEVYNSELADERRNRKHDFLVFMHSDVKLDVEHLKSHCESVIDKYDVMGLCGCEKVDTSESPLNWFCASRRYPQYRWGCVTHGELGNTTSYFSYDRTEITDHAVGCIDGLCIIFGPKAIDSEMCFDESFKFDQYDTDISFQTILKYHMRLGVIVEESLRHFSVGKSILSDNFLMNEIVFRKKWNLKIPPNTRLSQIIEEEKSKTP